jgi:predicted nicotinamide N-methyase
MNARAEGERRARFIREHTALARTPLLPELALALATEVTPLWHATEVELREHDLEPPFWAFAWAGGQALARFVLDHPELVRDRRVLDFASGSGLVAIAAALRGARVVAVDIDPTALAAVAHNAEVNGVTIEARGDDLFASDALPDWARAFDVVLAGDVFYQTELAERSMALFHRFVAQGARVFVGDPGRAYVPVERVIEVARYVVPTIDDVESVSEKTGRVLEVSQSHLERGL